MFLKYVSLGYVKGLVLYIQLSIECIHVTFRKIIILKNKVMTRHFLKQQRDFREYDLQKIFIVHTFNYHQSRMFEFQFFCFIYMY